MSYSLVPQVTKSKSFSKYLYANIDQSEDFFIFDIKFTSVKKKFKKIKKIKYSRSDMLIGLTDNINLNKYNKLEITIINLNNPNVNHNIEIDLTSDNKIYKDEFIYLELTSELNLLKCFYNLDIN